jgi:hypothetical protein
MTKGIVYIRLQEALLRDTSCGDPFGMSAVQVYDWMTDSSTVVQMVRNGTVALVSKKVDAGRAGNPLTRVQWELLACLMELMDDDVKKWPDIGLH